MKLIFAGTPEFANVILAALLAAQHEILAVYTQPDRPAGRGRKQIPGAVKRLALEQGLAIRQPGKLTSGSEINALLALEAQAMVVAAYGLLLPQGVLTGPAHGCINVHASLLPRWRGASPVQQAILAGDANTGISIMQMDAGLDTGPVLRQCPLPILADDTGGSLHDRLAALGGDCLLQCLEDIQQGRVRAIAQDEALVSHAPRLNKAQARIDWRQDAQGIERAVRAFNPWPVTHSLLPDRGREANQKTRPDTVLRIHAAQAVTTDKAPQAGEIIHLDRSSLVVSCGSDALKLLEVQLPGRRRLPVAEFLKAWPLALGDRFG